jgi:hypothetical protein
MTIDDLNDRINDAKLLDWSELHAHLVFRLFVREAEAKKLADFLRLCGPKAYLSEHDPSLLLKLLVHIVDDIAALIEVGVLTVKKRKGRGRPSDPRLEKSLERAQQEYKRIRDAGAFAGVNPDGTAILKRLSRAEAIQLVVAAWNRDVDERRERHRKEGRDPHQRTSVVKITKDQLEKQVDRRRQSARRYAKRKAKTQRK